MITSERNSEHRDENGHRLVVRNGHHPARKIQSGNGPIEVRQPRVNDKRVDEDGNRFHFTSQILPPYLRKTKAIEELVPWLYLKGISTSDFPEALACLGHDGSGLSATTVVRMKEIWQGEYENFSRRSLEGKRYVYLWADGIYFNIRLTDDRPCVLVLMGALEDGTKELIAMVDGERESEQSWLEAAAGRQEPRADRSSQACHRRRGVGILEGVAASLSLNPASTLLGA